jgi:hypothetical protein
MRHFSFSTMMYAALIILIAACSKDPLDDNGNSTQGLKLECFHEKTLTLTDRNTSGVDYIIDCGFSITSGSLIIEPGTTIQFEDGASITIEQNATIKAVGTAEKPIRFTNNGGASPSWAGIYIDTRGVGSEINHAIIEKAGVGKSFGQLNDIKAALTIQAASLALSNTQITAFGEAGFVILFDAELNTFTNNTFKDGNGYPVVVFPDSFEGLDFSLNTYSNNKSNYIFYDDTRTYFNSTNNKTTIRKAPIPYLIDKPSTFYKSLEMEAGVQIVCTENASIRVEGDGSFIKVNGTSNDHVIIKGLKAEAGYWGGILLEGTTDKNLINYLDISDGGSESFNWGPLKANIKMAGYNPTSTIINNSTFTRSGACDIALNEAFSVKTVTINNSGNINTCKD